VGEILIETPLLAVDGIVELLDDHGDCKGIVLIDRVNEPHGLALPGGFVDIGETVEAALLREMKEEISLNVSIKGILGVYSDPDRDPRSHCVSVVFICCSRGVPLAADDAKDVHICSLKDVPYESLVFDHKRILEDYFISMS
jgi:8-oxo-dGTP diphosphatase